MMKTPSEDLALNAPPINFQPGGAHASASRRWQGIPGIARTGNGRLWATWYSGGKSEGPFNYVILVTSGDEGETWSDPVLVVDPPGMVRAYDPVLWLDPNGHLWLFWSQCLGAIGELAKSAGNFDGRAGVWAIVSENPGEARPRWSDPRRLCHGILMNKPTVLADGAWLLPAAIWACRIPEFYDLPEERFSNVYASLDEGKTWTLRGRADVPNRSFDEHMFVERRDGSLWMLVRRNDGIGEATSTDGGKTWLANPDAIIAGPSSRFFVRRLQSGRLLLVYHFDVKERSHLAARLSDDEGKTWRGHLVLERRKGVSYPDGFQRDDGRLAVIYDFERYGEREICMTYFTEEEILRGHYFALGSRQRILIDKVPLSARDKLYAQRMAANPA